MEKGQATTNDENCDKDDVSRKKPEESQVSESNSLEQDSKIGIKSNSDLLHPSESTLISMTQVDVMEFEDCSGLVKEEFEPVGENSDPMGENSDPVGENSDPVAENSDQAVEKVDQTGDNADQSENASQAENTDQEQVPNYSLFPLLFVINRNTDCENLFCFKAGGGCNVQLQHLRHEFQLRVRAYKTVSRRAGGCIGDGRSANRGTAVEIGRYDSSRPDCHQFTCASEKHYCADHSSGSETKTVDEYVENRGVC